VLPRAVGRSGSPWCRGTLASVSGMSGSAVCCWGSKRWSWVHHRPTRSDDHGQVHTGAVYGPSQRTKRRVTTRSNTSQRRVFSLVGALLGAVIRRPAWSPEICCQSRGIVPTPGGCSYVKSVSAGDQVLPSPGWLVCRDGGASSRRPPGGLPPRGRAASLATTAAGW
jgi:hypothetical protein